MYYSTFLEDTLKTIAKCLKCYQFFENDGR